MLKIKNTNVMEKLKVTELQNGIIYACYYMDGELRFTGKVKRIFKRGDVKMLITDKENRFKRLQDWNFTKKSTGGDKFNYHTFKHTLIDKTFTDDFVNYFIAL